MLWVDQVCINQLDVQEKSQVLLMARIYERAYTTIVWLGEQKDHSDHAFEIIRRIMSGMRYETDKRRPDVDDFESRLLRAPGSEQWAELRSLLHRP